MEQLKWSNELFYKHGQMVDLHSLLLEHRVVEENLALFNSIHKAIQKYLQSTYSSGQKKVHV